MNDVKGKPAHSDPDPGGTKAHEGPDHRTGDHRDRADRHHLRQGPGHDAAPERAPEHSVTSGK